VKLTRRIVAAPSLARFAPEEFLPGPKIASDEELARAAGDISTTIFHPVGTCKMGTGDDAVVDSELRVRGIENLRVVDASVFPRIPGLFILTSVYMVSEKASDVLIAQHK
jgi:choline dehydrogenase